MAERQELKREEEQTAQSPADQSQLQEDEPIIVGRVSHPGISNPIYENPRDLHPDPSSVVHTNILCDGMHCGKLPEDETAFIRGVRFWCSVCAKDFCERCATDGRNDHDVSHGLIRVTNPTERGFQVAIRPEAGLKELVDCIVASGGILIPEFIRYYASIDAGTEQKSLLKAFRSLHPDEQGRFLQYLMAWNMEQRSAFLKQYLSMDDAGGFAYLRILIGVERVVWASSPIFDVFKREANTLKDSAEYTKMLNVRIINGHHVHTIEAVPQSRIQSRIQSTVRQKVFVYQSGAFPTTDHLFEAEYRYHQEDGLLDLWLAGGTGTRLMDLLPGNEGDELRCSIRTVLSLDPADAPAYEALSYTWKETSQERELLPTIKADVDSGMRSQFKVVHPIFCDQGHLSINTGLRDALVRLRHPTKKITLWVDQICIDQNNKFERSYHVRLMSTIFNCAKRVIVWTGVEDQHSTVAYNLMEAVAKRTMPLPTPTDLFEDQAVTVPPPDSADWESLFEFLGRLVFTRAWVVQEVAFGREVFVKCGANEIEFAKVAGAATMVCQPSWVLQGKKFPSKVSPVFVEYIARIRHSIQNQELISLHNILFATSTFGITDQRDKIYAFLGLVQLQSIDRNSKRSISSTYGIIPDYRKSPRDVFIEATKAIIMRDETLDVCGQAGLARMSTAETVVKNLPSWVPDFGVHDKKVAMSDSDVCPDFDATSSALPSCSWPFDGRPDVMELSAYTVDVVAQVAQQTYESHPSTFLQEWTRVASSVGDKYPNGTSMVSAFWQICTAIRTVSNPSFSSHDLFMGFYIFFISRTARDGPHSEEAEALLANPLARQLRQAFDKQYPSSPFATQPYLPSNVQKVEDAMNACLITVQNRRLFVTKRGYIGLGPAQMQPGNEVYVLRGARLLFLLLRAQHPVGLEASDSAYRIVGESYVHGLVRGEALRDMKSGWSKILVY